MDDRFCVEKAALWFGLCHFFDLYNMFSSNVQLCTVQGRNETTEPGRQPPPRPAANMSELITGAVPLQLQAGPLGGAAAGHGPSLKTLTRTQGLIIDSAGEEGLTLKDKNSSGGSEAPGLNVS